MPRREQAAIHGVFCEIGTPQYRKGNAPSYPKRLIHPSPCFNLETMDQGMNSYRKKDINADKSEIGNKKKRPQRIGLEDTEK